MLRETGFKEIYEENKERFLKLAKEHNPKLRYEAQDAALSIMINLSDDPIMKPLKKYAFANGKNLFDVLRLSGIYLRDQFIKELDLKE